MCSQFWHSSLVGLIEWEQLRGESCVLMDQIMFCGNMLWYIRLEKRSRVHASVRACLFLYVGKCVYTSACIHAYDAPVRIFFSGYANC